MKSKSDSKSSLLRLLSEEIAGLADKVVRSTAIVTGETRDFSEISGSAWLYDAETLVTNDHVVDELVEPIWVRLADCPAVRAVVVGRDPQTDLAVLHVEHQAASPLQLCQQPPRLGELCFALGSPLGDYPESMNIGIVSGLKRRLPTSAGHVVYDVIQTDCAINHGNSGGPLVSVDGFVLGVNSAGIDKAHGMGFAIPADTVYQIAPELLAHGAIERASLGVHVTFRRVDDGTGVDRLIVTAVRSSAAGPLETGDILLAIGTHPVQNPQDLLRVLGRDMVDRKVAVLVLRRGQQVSIECVPQRRGLLEAGPK
jgi:S1-C subfamily serine protease